jgi:hypothetical protein
MSVQLDTLDLVKELAKISLAIEFYESELVHAIYSWRRISVESLIQHINQFFICMKFY